MLAIYYAVYVGGGILGVLPIVGAKCTTDLVYPICFLIMWLINLTFIICIAVLQIKDFFID
jgi:hypothetical protein